MARSQGAHPLVPENGEYPRLCMGGAWFQGVNSRGEGPGSFVGPVAGHLVLQCRHSGLGWFCRGYILVGGAVTEGCGGTGRGQMGGSEGGRAGESEGGTCRWHVSLFMKQMAGVPADRTADSLVDCRGLSSLRQHVT